MKEKFKFIAYNLSGLLIPIIAIALCFVYDNKTSPSFNYLWLNLLLPFYLFFVNRIMVKDINNHGLSGVIASIAMLVVSCLASIGFVCLRYNTFISLEYNFIDFEMRYFRYRDIVFMLFVSIGVFFIMLFLQMLTKNLKSKKFSVSALAIACLFTVVVLLFQFGAFSQYDRIQCKNLCTNMLNEIFETKGNYGKCDSSVKDNISEQLYESIYAYYVQEDESNYEESVEYDCIGVDFVGNKAKVLYTCSYEQLDKEGELIYAAANDSHSPDVMTMEKIDNKWIIVDNFIRE